MATFDEAVAAWQELHESTGWTGFFPAKLGAKINGVEMVDVPEAQRRIANEVFVRRLDKRGIERPVNNAVEGQYDDTVWVGYPPNSSQLTIFSYFSRPGYGGTTNRGVQKHATQHVLEGWKFAGAGNNKIGSDPITVQENQFTFLSLRPVDGELSLQLTRGIYFIGGVPYFWNLTDAIDFTGDMPASGAALALVEIDAAKDVFITVNTDWSPYTTTSVEETFPTITPGRKIIGLVALIAGRTAFTVYDIWNLGFMDTDNTAVDAPDVVYVPAETDHWPEGVPANVTAALDTLAARTFDISENFPKRATMWHHQILVLTGDPVDLAYNIADGRPFAGYYQPNDDDGDSFTNGCFLGAGTYDFVLHGLKFNAAGIVDWYIDGNLEVAGDDWYQAGTSADGEYVTHSGVVVATSGWHEIKGIINGQNGSSSGFALYLSHYYFVPAAD